MSQLNQAIETLETEHAAFINKGNATKGRFQEDLHEARLTANTAMTERDTAQGQTDQITTARDAAGTAKDGAQTAMAATGAAHRATHLAKSQVAEAVREANQAKARVDAMAAGDLSPYDHWLLSSPVANGTLHLDFANNTYQVWENGKLVDKTFAEAVTFTRASTATYWDANGVLQTAAVDEPRLDHDPVTGEPLGLLVEESRTNLVINSITLDSHSLFGGGGNFEDAPTIVAPDGTNAKRHYATAGQSAAGLTFSAEAGVTYTISMWVAKATNPKPSIRFQSTEVVGPYIFEDLKQDELTRVSWTFTSTINGSYTVGLRDGGGDFYYWGAQLEQGSYPTSYIPTSGAAVTRSGESDIYLDLGQTYCHRSGTVFIDATYGDGASSNTYAKGGSLLWRFHRTLGEYVFHNQFAFGRYTGDFYGTCRDIGGSGYDRIGVTSLLPVEDLQNNTPFKVVVTFEAGVGFTTSVNGVYGHETLDGNLPPLEWTRLDLLRAYDGSTFNGHKRAFSYYPYTMTQTELEALTA